MSSLERSTSTDLRYLLILKDILVLTGLGIAGGFVAYNTGIASVYFLTALTAVIISLAIVSSILLDISDLSLTPVELRVSRSKKVEVTVNLKVSQPSILKLLGLSALASLKPLNGDLSWDLKDLLQRGDTFSFTFKLSLDQVKVYEKLILQISLSSNLGILVKTLRRELDVRWVSYPRELRMGILNEVTMMRRTHLLTRKGRKGDELSGIREFQEGDNVKDISWKHTARYGKLMVGLWSKGDENILIIPLLSPLDLETSLGSKERPLDDLLELTYSLISSLSNEDQGFSLLLPDENSYKLVNSREEARDGLTRLGTEPRLISLEDLPTDILSDKWVILVRVAKEELKSPELRGIRGLDVSLDKRVGELEVKLRDL